MNFCFIIMQAIESEGIRSQSKYILIHIGLGRAGGVRGVGGHVVAKKEIS